MYKYFLILFLLMNVLSGQNIQFDLDSMRVQPVSVWKIRYGDSLQWASPQYADSAWDVFKTGAVHPDPDSIRWYRTVVQIKGNPSDTRQLALTFRMVLSAYQVYWDGQEIAANGTPADRPEQEEAGTVSTLIPLSFRQIEPGRHLLAVRLSSHLASRNENLLRALIGYRSAIEGSRNRFFNIFLFDAGVFFLAALFSFALFLGGGRHRSYLMFAIFGLMNFMYPVLLYWTNSYTLSAQYFSSLQVLSYFIAPLAVIFLNIFFIIRYHLPNKYWHIGFNVLLTAILLWISEGQALAFLPLYSVGILVWAIRRKEAGSLIALVGLSVYTVFLILFFFNRVLLSVIAADIFFIFCILLSLSRQIKKENQWLEQSRLRSARLEAELLKKNIQPHFLMNTLLSVISWIEESPHRARLLIQALADEFRMINQISGRKEIALEQELQLCRTHLDLMGYRKEASYQLVDKGVNGNETIPPTILHTLIENGLTHSYRPGEGGTFWLEVTHKDGWRQFVMENDGSRLQNENQSKINEGMGLRYVKTRLKEAYGDRWNLQYGIKDNRWRVEINVHN